MGFAGDTGDFVCYLFSSFITFHLHFIIVELITIIICWWAFPPAKDANSLSLFVIMIQYIYFKHSGIILTKR